MDAPGEIRSESEGDWERDRSPEHYLPVDRSCRKNYTPGRLTSGWTRPLLLLLSCWVGTLGCVGLVGMHRRRSSEMNLQDAARHRGNSTAIDAPTRPGLLHQLTLCVNTYSVRIQCTPCMASYAVH
jgi:hypothetical protein